MQLALIWLSLISLSTGFYYQCSFDQPLRFDHYHWQPLPWIPNVFKGEAIFHNKSRLIIGMNETILTLLISNETCPVNIEACVRGYTHSITNGSASFTTIDFYLSESWLDHRRGVLFWAELSDSNENQLRAIIGYSTTRDEPYSSNWTYDPYWYASLEDDYGNILVNETLKTPTKDGYWYSLRVEYKRESIKYYVNCEYMFSVPIANQTVTSAGVAVIDYGESFSDVYMDNLTYGDISECYLPIDPYYIVEELFTALDFVLFGILFLIVVYLSFQLFYFIATRRRNLKCFNCESRI